MRWFTTMLALVVALTMGGGCVSAHDRASNGDRQLSYQNKSAAEKILAAAAELQNALMMLGVPAPAAAMAALKFIQGAATDIAANSSQQIKNWGGEERIEDKRDYSAEASAAARKAAEDEHARMTKWAAAIGVGMALLGWFSKTAIAAKIPFIGPVLAFLNIGQRKAAAEISTETALTNTLQAGVAEARKELDSLANRLRGELKGTALEKLGDLIPTGDVLVDRLETELARKGLLTLNTERYEANPLIPEDPAPVVLAVQPVTALAAAAT